MHGTTHSAALVLNQFLTNLLILTLLAFLLCKDLFMNQTLIKVVTNPHVETVRANLVDLSPSIILKC